MPLRILLINLLLLVAPLNSIHSQDVRDEFLKNARAKWLEARQRSFKNFSFNIKRKELEYNDKGKENRKIESESTWFAQDEFIFFESIPIADSNSKSRIPFGQRNVKISNGKEALMIRNHPKTDPKWTLVAREKLGNKLQFNPETLKPGWYQKLPRSVANSFAVSLADDPRFELSRTSPVEFYLQSIEKNKPEIFDRFTVKQHPILGRIVIATYQLKFGGKAAGPTVDGQFEFLADWNWLPLSMKSVTKIPKSVRGPARVTAQAFTATYDEQSIANAKANLSVPMPSKVVIEQPWSAGRKSGLKIVKTIRPLNMKEVAEINSLRDFKKFE